MKNLIIDSLHAKAKLTKKVIVADKSLNKIPETLDHRLLVRLQLMQITSFG